MKVYLIRLFAVGILYVIIELLISEGKLKKFITGALNVALIVAITLPLVTFVKNGSFSDVGLISTVNTDENVINDDSYVVFVTEKRRKNVENGMLNALKNADTGVNAVTVLWTEQSAEKAVSVNVDLPVIKCDGRNIDIIAGIVKSFVVVDRENIFINGKD